MNTAERVIDFIKNSPSPYHTVKVIKDTLVREGYTELSESDVDAFSDGGKHFVVRDGSSVIAFRGKGNGFMMCASHSDSPSFKVKGQSNGAYAKCTTEPYGGMIYYSWLDRPLSAAGRAVFKTESGIATRLVDLERDSFVIPSVAIHFNRGVNEGYKFNPASDMLPLMGMSVDGTALNDAVTEAAGMKGCDLISHDLYLYNRECGRVVGMSDELLLAPRIDDLGCVFASLCAFLEAEDSNSVSVLAVFDNEEVGSSTKQGANSTFLDMTLRAVAGSDSGYRRMLANSYMVSADNAHASHPNHPELSDAQNAPVLAGGVVIKYNANQRYTTDAVSDAIFRTLADRAGIKLQTYFNRADMPGGSTLGSICDTRVSVPSVDIGLPQLAMHSASETSALSDIDDMISVLRELYSSSLCVRGEDITIE